MQVGELADGASPPFRVAGGEPVFDRDRAPRDRSELRKPLPERGEPRLADRVDFGDRQVRAAGPRRSTDFARGTAAWRGRLPNSKFYLTMDKLVLFSRPSRLT